MLDVKKNQSTNNVSIVGILNELSVEEKTSSTGKAYVSAVAKIRVDTEINGQLVENEIPVRMFAMRNKSETSGGGLNPQYDSIVALKNNFTSVAAAENPADASRVYVSGRIEENIYVDRSGNVHKNGFQISAGTLYKARNTDEDKAEFELSGVIGNIKEELNKNDEPTGRAIVQYILAKWNGSVDVINLIADRPAVVDHINNNWNKGDTVVVGGKLSMYSKTIEIEEDLGFGEPIKRYRTEFRNELIITKGSKEGLDESSAYDNDSVKMALAARTALIEQKQREATHPAPTKSATDFGF